MNAAFTFLASRNGRITRIVIGAILLILGLGIGFGTDSLVGWIVAVIGLFPLIAGAVDICLFAPFFGHALKGPELRAELQGQPVPKTEAK